MGKIQFRSGKTKTKVFEDSSTDTKKSVLPLAEKADHLAELQEGKSAESKDTDKPEYRNAAEVMLYNKT